FGLASPATMIHQTAESSGEPELSLPLLPASESTWPADRSELSADVPSPETNHTPDEATAAPLDVDTSEAAGNPQDSFAEQVTLPWAEAGVETPELQAIASQAETLVRRGFNLASRGATFSARAQFNKALRILAESLDATMAVDHHCKSLAAGLTALKESEDFQQRALDQPLD